MIADNLYQLTPRDAVGQGIEPIALLFTKIQASIGPFLDHIVPDGFLYLVKNVSLRADPGAGQSCTAMRFNLVPPGLGGLMTLFELSSAAGSVASGLDPTLFGSATPIVGDRQFTDILVPMGWTLRCDASFSAAANPNMISMNIAAIKIPRGNVQI